MRDLWMEPPILPILEKKKDLIFDDLASLVK